MLKPISPLLAARAPTYREAAYVAIKEAILAGQIEPGQALIEERLAALLDISRTPVREALAILEHEGLIAPVYRRGLCMQADSRRVCGAVRGQPDRRAHFSALSGAARQRGRACGHGCGDQPRYTMRRRDGYPRLPALGPRVPRPGWRSSGNLPLTAFIERNEERVDLYLLSYGKAVDALGMQASNREHGTIFKAIVDRDPEAAARLVVYHAQSTRERWAALFNDAGDDDGVAAVDVDGYVVGD